MSTVIKPTVGRIVWFYPSQNTDEAGFTRHVEGGGPYAALIAHVWNDCMVNLSVFDANGTAHPRTSVLLLQGECDAPEYALCGWMPYQLGQARKDAASGVPTQALSAARIIQTKAEITHCQCDACASGVLHASGCAVHNAPALEPGPCDCGAQKARISTLPVVDPAPDSVEREIKAKASEGARVTPFEVEAHIRGEFYFTAEQGVLGESEMGTCPASWANLDQVTICVLILTNGTKIVGVNEGPVSRENFKADLGRQYARQKAVDQIWPLLGFRLRDQLANTAQ
jgi:hypothetical protein